MLHYSAATLDSRMSFHINPIINSATLVPRGTVPPKQQAEDHRAGHLPAQVIKDTVSILQRTI